MRDSVRAADAAPQVLADRTAGLTQAWRQSLTRPSLGGAYRSLPGPRRGTAGALAFLGPGLMVAVGYIDPGNWATGLAAGSAYGYELLFVIGLASLAGVMFQGLAAKLGVVTGRDLAQACRGAYGPRTRVVLWLLCEAAICACDLAELLGAAVALNLLFGLPLMLGAALTALDVIVLIGFGRLGLRRLEAAVAAILLVVAGGFVVQLALAQPSLAAILGGLVPHRTALSDPGRLYLAVGILGATVMPHNLYLHSALVQTRRFELTDAGRAGAIRGAVLAGAAALGLAALVNGALVALAAAVFHAAGTGLVDDLARAHALLEPLLGPLAAAAFAVALLASAQNATVTGTLAGQIVMEGFVELRLAPWKRRLLTRSLALAPTLAVLAVMGDGAVGRLLILSQVVLSLQLPFALVPLVRLTSDRRRMGRFANGPALKAAAWAACAVVIAADAVLLVQVGQAG